MKIILFALFSFVFATPLDDYLALPDPIYQWNVSSSFRGFEYTAYNIFLTSQTWLTPNASTSYIWRHWVQVCVPDKRVDSDLAFLYIDGGSVPLGTPPTTLDGESAHLSELLCVDSQTISVVILQIPNEPIVFSSDPLHKRRTEDAIIAFTWRHFIDNPNEPYWLLRMPMVKAVVKAMDAVQEFTSTLDGPGVQRFVVAGASKRGWTTWLVGAVDPRVAAIIPMVMPILNIVPNMLHHFQAYNGWSFALDDYIQENIMGDLYSPEFQKLASIVDPWAYRDRLTLPKLILTAAGDEFFLPDSPKFFIKGLIGETHLTTIPDAEHALITAYVEVGENLCAFYNSILYNIPRPIYNYSLTYGNESASITVTVDPSTPPNQVKVWSAHTLEGEPYRDFRLVRCENIEFCINPVIWEDEDLSPISPNTYSVTMNAPKVGWTGFLIELTYFYEKPTPQVLKLSTVVNVVPETMPFQPCGNNCQPTATQPDKWGIYH